MKKLFEPFVGSALANGSFAYYIYLNHSSVAESVTNWILHRRWFSTVMAILVGIIAARLMLAGQRRSILTDILSQGWSRITGLYASSAGSICGWIFGVTAAAFNQGSAHAYSLLILAFFALFELSSPLWFMVPAVRAVEKYKQNIFHEKWQGKAVILLGWTLVPVAMYIGYAGF